MLRLMKVSECRRLGDSRLIFLCLLIEVRIFWNCFSLVVFAQVFLKIQELPLT